MPHFQLVTSDGEALGVVEVGPEPWNPGHVITRGKDDQLRIVDRLNISGDPEKFDILVVENIRPPSGDQ